MAVIAWTNNPENLKALFLNALKEEQLETWSFREGSEVQVTHTTGQWDDLAWFETVISTQNDAVIFKICYPANANLDEVRDVYGIYHGRLIEVLIRRFYTHFTDAKGTGRPRAYDIMTTEVRERLNSI